jgi:hypothetical protein
MEGNDRESMHPTIGGEQTSFGSQLNPGFEKGNTGDTEPKLDDSSSGSGVTDRVKSAASSVKRNAAAIPSMLADGLAAGAEALRQRRPSTGSSTAGSSVVIADDSSIAAVTDTLATGMQSSADWLRDADIEKLKQGVEKQVKEHPARSLLVALGAGYLIGKALRR